MFQFDTFILHATDSDINLVTKPYINRLTSWVRPLVDIIHQHQLKNSKDTRNEPYFN